MWKRRPRRGRKASAQRRIWPQALLWALLAIETLWLAAFMLASGSPLPPVAERWLAGRAPGPNRWTPAQERRLETSEEQLTELQLQKLLAEKGSQGPATAPVPPAAPAE